MKRGKWDKRQSRIWAGPPIPEEGRYVISASDARAYQGGIVAVNGFPTSNRYAKVIAFADGLKEIKWDLQILGILEHSTDKRDTVTVHVIPGSDVLCYVSVSRSKPQIIRKIRKGDAL